MADFSFESSPGRSAGRDDSDARSLAREASQEVRKLRTDLDRLYMITEALWELLRDKQGLTEDDLFKKVLEVDMKDGKLDGKVSRKAANPCPHCNRPLLKQSTTCLYCGKPVQQNPFDR